MHGTHVCAAAALSLAAGLAIGQTADRIDADRAGQQVSAGTGTHDGTRRPNVIVHPGQLEASAPWPGDSIPINWNKTYGDTFDSEMAVWDNARTAGWYMNDGIAGWGQSLLYDNGWHAAGLNFWNGSAQIESGAGEIDNGGGNWTIVQAIRMQNANLDLLPPGTVDSNGVPLTDMEWYFGAGGYADRDGVPDPLDPAYGAPFDVLTADIFLIDNGNVVASFPFSGLPYLNQTDISWFAYANGFTGYGVDRLDVVYNVQVQGGGCGTVTPTGPFSGAHSEGWESFPNYLTDPNFYMNNPTAIMGGNAQISHPSMAIYEPAAGATFGLADYGLAQVASGAKAHGIDTGPGMTVITFANPVDQFGGYWGAAGFSGNPSTPTDIQFDFYDASGCLIDSATVQYSDPSASGQLMWAGWTSNTPIARVLYTGDYVVNDDLQAGAPTGCQDLVVTYTASGSAGNWVLDFEVENNLNPADMDVYFFGVYLDTGRDIVGSPAGYDPNAWTSWDNSGYGGSSVVYNNIWLDQSSGYTLLLPGNSLSGFEARYTGSTAPSAVRFFAYGYSPSGGTYSGGCTYFNNNVNPGFEGAATLVSSCPPDFNGDGILNSQDFIAFLNAFTAGDPSADYNGDGTVNSQDFIAFLNDFVAGCP